MDCENESGMPNMDCEEFGATHQAFHCYVSDFDSKSV